MSSASEFEKYVYLDYSMDTIVVFQLGTVLQLVLAWPKPMCKVDFMHILWFYIEKGENVSKDHPKLGGFERSPRELRAMYSDLVYSISKLSYRSL